MDSPIATVEEPMLYVDPSAGSIVLQAAIAAIFAGLLFVKRWWDAATGVIRRSLDRLRGK
jgi:hypothetical protein